MRERWVRRGVKIAMFATMGIPILGFVVMGLWNWLVPAVFGGHTITFWQALGLLVLSKILFGGFHGRPGRHMHWRRRMMERWEKMTPEEREKFGQGLREGCGRRGVAPAEPKVAAE